MHHDNKTMVALYALLPKGIIKILTNKIGVSLLIVVIIINHCIIKKNYKCSASNYVSFSKWIVLFIVLYIFLLPLGGYRPYRPYILRYDTFIPALLAFFFLYGYSTFFLLKNTKGKMKIVCSFFYILVGLVYSIADTPKLYINDCERASLMQLSTSTSSMIKLDHKCSVLSWDTITNPNSAKLNAELLKRWNITKKEVLYYYEEGNE